MYRQCQNVFPNYAEWQKPEKMLARRHFIKHIISDYDSVILAKLSELLGDEWPLDLLGWMYCCHGPVQRRETIKGYKKMIDGINDGTIRREPVSQPTLKG